MDGHEVDVVDLTVAGSSSLEPIYCVPPPAGQPIEPAIEQPVVPVIVPPVVAKKHSFFSLFEDKVQKQKEAENLNFTKRRHVMLEKAPVFPSFLGTPCLTADYNSLPHIHETRKGTGFDLTRWSQLPIPRSDYNKSDHNMSDPSKSDHNMNDPYYTGTFTDQAAPYRVSGVDQVYQAILDQVRGVKPARRWTFHDQDDEDDWLPSGFRDLSVPKSSSSVVGRHVHLVVGPSGTGKSFLATRLATELGAPLTSLSVVGTGPKGERTGKPFEDLLTSAEHHDLLGGSTDLQVVLIDEIDLVFEGDRGFVSGLATYLANVPPRHVVVMTSNAHVSVLARFYSFTRDIRVHELQESSDRSVVQSGSVDFASIERTSQEDFMSIRPCQALSYEGESPLITCIDDWHGPSNVTSAFHRASAHLFTKYARYITAQKYRPPPPTLSTWHTDRLPAWYRLEVAHAAAEEERALLKRRRQSTMRFVAGSRITSYLRFPRDITAQVLSMYSLE